MLGFVAENIIQNKIKLAKWNDIDPSKPSNYTILDIRENMELMVFEIPQSCKYSSGRIKRSDFQEH